MNEFTTITNQYCKLLNIEDLIYHSSEQYLVLCLKICNLIIKYKCNINTLIDINKYKQKFNLTSSALTTAISTSTAIGQFYNSSNSSNNTSFINNNSLFESIIYNSNINYYYYNQQFINNNNNNDLQLQLSNTNNNLNNRTLLNGTSTLSLPYSSLTIPLLLLNLNETECSKYGKRESHKLSLFILGIILSFFILILNGLTLNTIIRTRRLHTITNILIANLSLSDFLSGCAFLYPCILNLLTINALETYNTYLYELACNIKQYYYICLVGYSPIITSMLSSIFTLTLLATEKYVAILKPYLYETLCLYKNKLLPLLICLSWLISIIVSLLPIMGWNEYHQTTIVNEKQKIIHKSYRGFNCTHPQSMPCMFEKIFTLGYILLFTVICCVCALTMLAIYIRIYIVARKHSKQIALQMTHFSNFKTFVKKKKNEDDENMSRNQHEALNKITSSSNSTNNINNGKRNYEKICFNTRVVNERDDETTVIMNNNNRIVDTPKAMIHQSISLTTYVDLNIDILNIKEKNSTPNFLLSSSSLLSLSPNNTNDEFGVKKRAQEDEEDEEIEVEREEDETNSSKNGANKTTTTTTDQSFEVSISTKSLNVSMKAMKTLLILLLGFYICWLPLIVYFLTFASQKYNNLTIYILMFVACCNAVIDPLVYAFRNREFYKALLLNFKKKN